MLQIEQYLLLYLYVKKKQKNINKQHVDHYTVFLKNSKNHFSEANVCIHTIH